MKKDKKEDKGKFIVLEGGEGSGKTTILRSLRDDLIAEKVVVTREPGGSPYGEELRKALLDSRFAKISVMAELMTYCAARADHCEQIIRPALTQGKIVLCDRFSPSSYAYQIAGRQRENYRAALDRLDALARGQASESGELVPDLVIWLDVPPIIGLQRRRESKHQNLTHMDLQQLEFHQAVHQEYAEQYQRNKNLNWTRINAEHGLEYVKYLVLEAVGKIL